MVFDLKSKVLICGHTVSLHEKAIALKVFSKTLFSSWISPILPSLSGYNSENKETIGIVPSNTEMSFRVLVFGVVLACVARLTAGELLIFKI